MRGQRGSVARSTCGCNASRIPTATYSCLELSANSLVNFSSPIAASPNGSHHWENVRALIEKIVLLKWLRGSEAMVMGIPSLVESSIYRCMLLYHFAIASIEGTAQRL